MATITTINSTDAISDSRSDINNNFANLNSDKLETSYLDTDTTLAANSDTKIPSQKAVKTYIDTSGGANASETVRGIVEEATDAEVTAGSSTGATGAKLFVTPEKLATRLDAITSSMTSFVPQMPWHSNIGVVRAIASSTIGLVSQFIVPVAITINKITIRTGTVNSTGTVKLAIYSEDGATRLVNITTATITATTDNNKLITTAVSSVELTPGAYYFLVVPDSGFTGSSSELYFWTTSTAAPWSTTEGLMSDVTSEPLLFGQITGLTSGTTPTTITPTGLAEVTGNLSLVVRFDN